MIFSTGRTVSPLLGASQKIKYMRIRLNIENRILHILYYKKVFKLGAS